MRPKTYSLVILLILMFPVVFTSYALASDTGKGDEAEKALLPPVILFPDERAEFRGQHKLTFMWNWRAEASEYHIILARDRAFKNIAYEKSNITATSYEIDNLGYGTYFFKISSISSAGRESAFSDTRTFMVVPPPPAKVR